MKQIKQRGLFRRVMSVNSNHEIIRRVRVNLMIHMVLK